MWFSGIPQSFGNSGSSFKRSKKWDTKGSERDLQRKEWYIRHFSICTDRASRYFYWPCQERTLYGASAYFRCAPTESWVSTQTSQSIYSARYLPDASREIASFRNRGRRDRKTLHRHCREVYGYRIQESYQGMGKDLSGHSIYTDDKGKEELPGRLFHHSSFTEECEPCGNTVRAGVREWLCQFRGGSYGVGERVTDIQEKLKSYW